MPPDQLPRPSILLYDWDNTLVDAWAGVAAALNAAFSAFGMPHWTPEQTKSRVRTSLRDSFPDMFGAKWTWARDLFYASLAEQHLDHVRPMPGAEQVLSAGAPWPQGVVSNKTGRFLRAEVTHLAWDPHFRAIVGAGDARADKPSPEPILMALERIGAAADRSVWYIGDTATDMHAARAAGVTAILIGDAAHEGGLDRVARDHHFPDAHALAQHLLKVDRQRGLASG